MVCHVKKWFLVLVAFLLLTCGLCPVFGADLVNLKMNLTKGQIFDFNIGTDSTIVQIVNNRDINVKQQINMTMSCEVTDIDAAGAAIMKITFDGIKFHQESPTGTVDFDSATPAAEASPATLGFSALVGANFTIKMSDRGAVQDVQGIDAMFEAMFQKMNLDSEKSEMIRQSLKNQFSDQALKEMTQQASVLFPQQPIAVGDTWSNRITLSRGYPIVIESTYKLRDYRDGVAYLDIDSTVLPNGDAAPIDFGAFKIKYSFTGTQEGTMEIQTANGFACSGKMTQWLTGQIEFNSAEMEGAMKWPMRVESIVNVDVKERGVN